MSVGINVNEETASYIISVDGSTYYAINCKTGIITTNVNAATLINACISALPTNGGKIVIKGLIPISSSIIIPFYPKSLWLEGEGKGNTILTLANGVNVDLIKTNTINNSAYACKISNMTLKGNKDNNLTNGHGIYGNFYDSYFDDLEIFDFREECIHFEGDSTHTVHDNYIQRCFIGGLATDNKTISHGITLGNYSNDNYFYDNFFQYGALNALNIDTGSSSNATFTFKRNHIYRFDRGIAGKCWYSSITDNYIEILQKEAIKLNAVSGISTGDTEISSNRISDVSQDGNGTYDAIYLEGLPSTYWAIRFIITKNTFKKNVYTNLPQYNIHALNNASSIIICDNNFVHAGVTATMSLAGSGHIIKNNLGYVTKNNGSGTITASSTYVEITHGLAVTPTIDKIKLTPQDNLYGRTVYVSDITSTTFRINMSTLDLLNHIVSWSYEY